MLKQFWQNNSVPVLSAKLGALGIFMFCFALFIMPPLYDLFCDITGLNGKTGGPFVETNEWGVDTSRTVKVQFIAHNNEGMPWDFKPTVSTVEVNPGEPAVIHYFAHNPTNKAMIGQAVPSVVPFKAANYFHKTECFCFNQQPLAAGESAELGLSFIVDIDLPKHVKKITLSYTLFDISDPQATQSAESATEDFTDRYASRLVDQPIKPI